MTHTEQQFDKAIQECQDIFEKKLKDYGTAWRIMRPESVTDQIYIKAGRIRSLETKKTSRINEGIKSELIAIVNYGIIGIIQLNLGASHTSDITNERAAQLYSETINKTKQLMLDKNHDYDEAWRTMRTTSYTDLILMKIHRTKQIESAGGKTIISEGIDANYMDMINYAIFALIRIEETSTT